MLRLIALPLLFLAALPLAAETLDPAVPTPRSVLGYDIGEYHTSYLGVVRYVEALARAAPDRVRLVKIGESYERRPIWNPQTFIDHHGQTENFFFPPVALPTNGGGRLGLRMERDDETIVTLRDGVDKHVEGGLAVLLTTARERERKLRDYYRFRRTAIEEGRSGPTRAYVLLPGTDPARAASHVGSRPAPTSCPWTSRRNASSRQSSSPAPSSKRSSSRKSGPSGTSTAAAAGRSPRNAIASMT